MEGVGQVQVVLMTEEKKEIQGFYDSGIQQVTGVLVCAQGGGDPVVVTEHSGSGNGIISGRRT